ncbi:protein AGENET DOMAIN (AGD)-CONTAINING P1-like isoform X2 [Amaranthus tricolor]|uniref:protein AGENET DOMAIN (AGD)-CONTAINING P1-like isoform X2 n=1 Tax=Amaranthus tricolor TaxID=29722 RepID=UPI002584E72B|nr:protein AGENET DOMAIN (AGD)-CONTAINING P1-like isoform X2 [Amaranthus tricolor]XP_057538175.1 protein AGENET DOMAIN (AGD)-CONTAINING P1-like isoform X2 [Amaranthus tricolor]
MQVYNVSYRTGDNVEVIKRSAFTTSFHPATILTLETNRASKRKRKRTRNNNKNSDDEQVQQEEEEEEHVYLVQYQNQQHDIVSYVDFNDIRPQPPQSECFKHLGLSVNDKVDILNDGYWIKGTILAIFYEGFKYLVEIDGDDGVPIEVFRSNLRVHRDYCHGYWIPPPLDHFPEATSGTITKLKTDANGKQLKLRIKVAKRLSEPKFSPGMPVEVKSDEDGYQGSWYTAIVIGSVGVGQFLVEYETLKTEDEKELLKEVANEQYIRPQPPHIPKSCKYKLLDEIDASYNDGWWEGVIYEILDKKKYIVYFASSNEKLVFHHSNLRFRQIWINSKWVLASQHKSSNLKLRISSSKRQYTQNKEHQSFDKATIVEVRIDEPGYEGSWYSARIVRLTQKSRYLVEYLTLKTEDGRKSLKEEAEFQNIRPCPPNIRVDGCFSLLEKVDAWYNDGWWFGVISKVFADKKYLVYFETTKEELEFHHVNLRTHQEWIQGKWINANKEV